MFSVYTASRIHSRRTVAQAVGNIASEANEY